MLKSRWFNVLIAGALLVMLTLLTFQGIATAQVASPSAVRSFVASPGAAATTGCAFSGDDVHSIRAVYEQARGMWLVRTAHGFAGVDGGALELRNCRASDK